MGLETGTFLSDLTTAWPLASDQKRQGDDHIRLIKSVLKNTFPNADKPFYFPELEATAVTITLDATDNGRTITTDTSGGNVAVNLPAGLTAADAGFYVEIVKVTADGNAAMVTPAAGNVLSKVGSTTSIRVGQFVEPARFTWNGSFWLCYKPGAMIGSVEEFDGATLPPGYIWSNTQVYTQAAFPELFAVTGLLATRDRRGLVTAAPDNLGGAPSALRLNTMASTTLGAIGGVQIHTITAAQMASHAHTGSSFNVNSQADSPDHSHAYERYAGHFNVAFGGDASCWSGVSIPQTGGANTTHVHNTFGFVTMVTDGANQSHNNIQPTMIANKIVRGC